MTDFLFVLSKLFWFAARPGTFALLVALAGLAAVWRGWRWGRWPILAGLGFYLSLLLLPRIKGAMVGLQWARRMHGFGGKASEAEPT